MRRIRLICVVVFCLFLCGCGKQGVTLPKLTQEELEILYQQEFAKHDDKLPADVLLGFSSLFYDGRIYTMGRRDEINLVYPADVESTPWDSSISEYPLEKICDVHGEAFVKPLYAGLSAEGKRTDAYAWFDDEKKVKGELLQGTIWKFGEYDPQNLVVLSTPEKDQVGNTVYRLRVFYHLNDIYLETGKDLLDIILDPLNAEQYGVMKQPETLQRLSGDKPEDVFFLGDVYEGGVVTEDEVKNPDDYSEIMIKEKEPYGRIVYFRDYGDGIIGYCTPEGTMIYIRIKGPS